MNFGNDRWATYAQLYLINAIPDKSGAPRHPAAPPRLRPRAHAAPRRRSAQIHAREPLGALRLPRRSLHDKPQRRPACLRCAARSCPGAASLAALPSPAATSAPAGTLNESVYSISYYGRVQNWLLDPVLCPTVWPELLRIRAERGAAGPSGVHRSA